jgi:hypothetical protein
MNSNRADEQTAEKKTTGQTVLQVFLYILAAIALMLTLYYGGPLVLSFMSSSF